MPLTGTRPSAALSTVAEMPDCSTEDWTLDGVTVLHALYETGGAALLAHLPRALTPSIPASLYLTAWDVPESPAGPFRLAQVRLGCRAGVRGRGLLSGAVIDSERAGRELEARWGYSARQGEIALERNGDVAALRVSVDGAPVLALSLPHLEPASGEMIQWPASLHAARVASESSGDRPLLVQVDPEYEFYEVMRGRPTLTVYEASAWGLADVTPTTVVAGTVARVRLRLPRLRFVIDPDASVAESTRRVNSATV